nr:sister chromatid cohesion 1 protein 4 isoform X1 [Ipomoea batatas]
MFYSQFILAKKGPLGTIWIAAHLERKLRKNQVADTDIGDSVDSILFPDVPIALRLSSHLLLGVVRIYSRKVNYLFDDCSEAVLKVKQAFRSTAVDLPPEESKAPYHSITLPETFELDDFELPDNDIFQGNYVDHHVSSREQITLQDTMEGVTYSTSKFGLDERFGDGDTSGLDLDEELLLEKFAATGDAGPSTDPQASAEPMTPLKQDELNDASAANSECMIDGADGDANFMEYAQAPDTPGLVEEPNLSNVQETSACDDLLEPECQHLTESDMKENLGSISQGLDVHDGSSLQGNLSLHSDTNPNGDVPSEENGFHSGNGQFPPPGISNYRASSDDNTLASGTPSVPVDTVNAVNSSVLELTDNNHMIINASDDLQREEHLQNGIFNHEKVDVSSDGGFHEDGPIPNGISMEESAPGLTSVDLSVSENILQSDQTSLNVQESITCQEQIKPNDLTSSEIHILKSCGTQVSQANASIPCHDPVLESRLPSDVSGLCAPETSREETSCASVPSTTFRGEVCHSTDNVQQISEDNHMKIPSSCEDNHAVYLTSNDQVQNLCSSAHDLAAPEKLLSVPGGLVDLSRSVVEEATPGELTKVNESDAAESNNLFSGRKRSYTESTLTEQSLNSFESSRMAHSTRTKDFFPDDDDLLSSILAGKRSSALKLKPTPPCEITSSKRPRIAPRASTSKRKVLMDDNMVLHGDTIRQQLTNTEDIRRVRKRAPCTCQEISVIQKQLLEDDIFSEPALTGVSVKLVCLNKQTFDLTGIKVLQNDVTGTSFENVTDKETSVNDGNSENLDIQITNNLNGPEVTTENWTEGSDKPLEIGDGCNVEAVLARDKHVESYDLDLDNNDATQMLMGSKASVAEAHTTQVELSENAVETSNEETNISLAGAANSASSAGVCLPFPSGGALSNGNNESTGLLITDSFDESKEMDAPVLIDASLASTDHVRSGQDVTKMDLSNNELLNASDFPEQNTVDNVEIESDPRIGGRPLSETSQVDPAVEVTTNVEYDTQNLTSNDIWGELPTVDSLYSADDHMTLLDATIDAGGVPSQQETYLQSMFDVEASGVEVHDPNVSDYTAAMNDTGTRFADNSGWSSRTRAVAKFLQTVLTKEAEYGRNALSMDSLLVGKKRKEASRMFFEALVLKTKDYIHVEQVIPFDNITIQPRMPLMKSDF